MKIFLAAAVALSVLLPAFAEPPKAQRRADDDVEEPAPVKPPQGTTVLVPPLLTGSFEGTAQPPRLIRLPVEAGRVSKMVTTNLVAELPSWIAKGDKYYSLCMPNRGKVACAPIAATATMKGIEVGAYAEADGTPKITFKIEPGATQGAKRLIASMNYFLVRASVQAEHFNRKASAYAPLKSRTPGALKTGPGGGGIPAPLTIDSGMGSSCSYDDYGGYDCSGGDSGYDGGGYDDDSYDWGDDYFGDESNWEDPTSPSLPTFPFGSNNGDADPCLDASGNNLCGPPVVITGQRPDAPQEMAMPTCVVTPWVLACNRTPPVVVDPIEVIPKGETPWFAQTTCDKWNLLCSAGQVPRPAEPPPITEEERRKAARYACYREANAALTVCHNFRSMFGDSWFETCKANALAQGRECSIVGMDR